MSTSNIHGTECIIVFPEKDFAQEHIKLEKSRRVKKKDLYKFINWLEKDKSNELNLAVFPNQNNEARIMKSSELKNDFEDLNSMNKKNDTTTPYIIYCWLIAYLRKSSRTFLVGNYLLN